MKQALTRWMMAASVAASVGLAQPGAAGAAATFVDAAAWQAAISGLKLPKAQTMPAIAPERITMSDAFGTWTLATADTTEVWFQTEGPPQAWPRTTSNFGGLPIAFLGVRSGEGRLELGFGCYSPVFPCLGMRVAELSLKTPIMGFAGDLRYFLGMAIPHLGREGIITLLDGVKETFPFFVPGSTYEGFYGVLFDKPTDKLRFAWQEDYDTDDGASVRFNNMVTIGVSEPNLVATFGATVLMLTALARRQRPRPAVALHRIPSA